MDTHFIFPSVLFDREFSYRDFLDRLALRPANGNFAAGIGTRSPKGVGVRF